MNFFNKHNKRIGNKGYTLVELVVAGIILLIVMLSVSAIIIGGSKFNREDMLRRRAFQVMEEFFERHEYGFKNYRAILADSATTNPGSALNWITDDSLKVIYENGGSSKVTGVLQYASRRELFSYGTAGTSDYAQIPAISFHVKITYNLDTIVSESLSTLLTDVPVN